MKNYLILKNICKKVYFFGSGDFWYEKGVIGDDKSFKYKLLSNTLFFIYLSMTMLEILAVLAGDLPKDEKGDAIALSASHVCVLVKIYSVIFNRELVKKLMKQMVQICEAYEEEAREVKYYKIMKVNVYAYIVTVYGCISCMVFEGIRKVITVVMFWPLYEDNSVPAVSFRIFVTIVLWVLMATMLSIDCLAMLSLIMYKYKYITLIRYFENLREEFDRNNYAGNENNAADQLESGLIDGIVMHRDLLSMSKDIDRSFGTVLAVQVLLSFVAAVTLLLQVAFATEISMVALMKVFFFITGLFFPLGLFLCNAGEITYQASLIANAIFYCGWHACAMRRTLRHLVLLSCARAQRPLVMKAFKMLDLTYGTFLTVVRSTYSVFAVFYARNKNTK